MMWEIVGLMDLLKAWKRKPDAPPSEYSSWYIHRERHRPFTAQETQNMRDALRKLSLMSYYLLFPEERPEEPDGDKPGQTPTGPLR
jgi:hypothetical protein